MPKRRSRIDIEVDLDDELLATARKMSGIKNVSKLVDVALRSFVQREREARKRNQIHRQTRASLMSNTRWRELFGTLSGAGLGKAYVKLLGASDIIALSGAPRIADVSDDAVDVEGGPIEFRDIEWIEFPRSWEFRLAPDVPAKACSQDIEKLHRLLRGERLIPVEETSEGFRVMGYLPA